VSRSRKRERRRRTLSVAPGGQREIFLSTSPFVLFYEIELSSLKVVWGGAGLLPTGATWFF
jgi:hypothetical protein